MLLRPEKSVKIFFFSVMFRRNKKRLDEERCRQKYLNGTDFPLKQHRLVQLDKKTTRVSLGTIKGRNTKSSGMRK